jgi:hypothetical protein
MNEYMQSVLANIKGYTKIYSSSVDGYNLNTFHTKCEKHSHTIIITKSNFAKILGGYSPMKWKNFESTVVTGGQSFIFFYEDDQLRICTQKQGAKVLSTGGYLCIFSTQSYNSFLVNTNKTSGAGINNSCEYNFPAQTDIQKQGEYLYFSGSGKREFTSEIFEVFGIDLNV